MNCINCYQEIPDGTNFCPYCGAKQSGYPAPAERLQENPVPGSVPPENAAPAGGFQENRDPVNTPQENSQEETAGPQETQEETAAPQQAQEMSEASAPQNNRQDNKQPYSAEAERTPDAAEMPGQDGQPYQAPPAYQQPYQSGIQEKPVNWVPYLILSIISTLCCCLPLGIAGIVYSAKINSMTTAGRPEEAKQAARTATIWIIIAFVVGLILDICAFLLVLTASVTDSYYGGIFDVIRHLAH